MSQLYSDLLLPRVVTPENKQWLEVNPCGVWYRFHLACVCVIKAKGAYDSRSYRRGILSAAGFNKSVCGLILST